MAEKEFIGHYHIVSELGRGGMGVVYKAHEESLNRFVAIKVLGKHLTSDASYVQRFAREAQAAAKLSHPNIVQIYFIGEDDGQHYFVMEFVHGTSVQGLVRSQGRLQPAAAARLVLQAASGLSAAHAVGIIHRDIKPANLLVDDRGLVKIADFGLALATEAATRLTATGMFMGTPGYLSPEQCLNEKVDHRADIYSLGVTFYEMLTGQMPFHAESPLALLRQIVEVEPPPVHELNPDVDDELRAVISQMMAKDPAQRYPNCRQLITDLQKWLAAHADAATAEISDTEAAVGVIAASSAHEARTELNLDPTVVVAGGSGSAPSPTPPPVTPPPAAPPPGAPAQPAATVPAPKAAQTATAAPPTDASSSEPAVPTQQPTRQGGGGRSAVAVVAIIVLLLALGATAAVVAWKSGALARAWAAVAGSSEQEQATESTEVPSASSSEPVSSTPTDAGQPGTTQAMREVHDEPGAPTGFADRSAAGAEQPQAVDTEETTPASRETAAGPKTADTASAASTLRRSEAAGAVREPASSGKTGMAHVVPAAAPSGVAVVAYGEPLFAGEGEQYLESRLAKAGVKLIDEKTLPGVMDLVEGDHVSTSDLLRRLSGVAARVVLLRVEYLGDRQLRYMGRSEPAYQSRLTLMCVDPATGKALAPSWTEKVEYTRVQTSRAAEKSLRDPVANLVALLKK
ncbi:MAG: protein kinase [Acidobacteria bacterium]|nr:protein kinase [Acidobacteriota bacterium]